SIDATLATQTRPIIVVVALCFVAATSAIDSRAQSLIDEFARLPDPADDDLSERLRRRNDLSALVGSGGSWRSFETTVIIAAPLLTALIGSATSG
ncbi:MAG TPA: hypothetical protein VFI47_21425, partial [Acidimicrobiales bacterium]|nr:hypothetical protein [Acidimicrobiales bacterium]